MLLAGGSVGFLGQPPMKVSFGPHNVKAALFPATGGSGRNSLLKSNSTPNPKPKQYYLVNPESYVNVTCEAVDRDTR